MIRPSGRIVQGGDMGQVTITLNGRSYRLRCGDGEEKRLLELAEHVDDRLASLVAEFGQVGDERLLLMTALMIADELFDARAALLASGGNIESNASPTDLTPGLADDGAGPESDFAADRPPSPSELMLRRVMRRGESRPASTGSPEAQSSEDGQALTDTKPGT
ncbi:MAG TPA: cell division protein ZapA [Hyphomicrobiaceae bacterium]|nr:cell division protein ZapA [Hyphomicrobiaceae bacterium]